MLNSQTRSTTHGSVRRAQNPQDWHESGLAGAIEARPEHEEVWIAYQVAQDVRALFHADTPATGRAAAKRLLKVLPTCPIPEVKRLGRTLTQWAEPLLAYFTTGGASNGGTEAVNGLIELHRRIARGFRKPRQLPTTLPAHRRRTHPMTPRSGPKSRQTRD